MKIVHFTNVSNVEELKKEYRRLARLNHPDVSSNENATKIMQEINKEYDFILENTHILHNQDENIDLKGMKLFKNIIMKLVQYDNININLIGSWLWVEGETFPIKDELKKIGFRFSKGKKSWYYFDGIEKAKRTRGRKKSLEEISRIYGRKTIKSGNSKKLLPN